ncbi:MAG: energy transducer TonB [Spirochaetales bacterium]|nr:energy transducer TonB [Spirochaetales bacterium]
MKICKRYVYAFFIAILIHTTIICAGELLVRACGVGSPEKPMAGIRPHALHMEILSPAQRTVENDPAGSFKQVDYRKDKTADKSSEKARNAVSTKYTDVPGEYGSAKKEGDPFYRSPRPVTKISPVYPLGAQLRKERGVVLYKVRVNALGIVETVELIQSSGFSALDKAAFDAVKAVEFEPALYKAEPVAGEVIISIRFE